MRLLFATIFTLVALNVNSQNIDSLLHVAHTSKNDSVSIAAFNKAAFYYIFNDTGKAKAILTKGRQKAINSRNDYGLTELLITEGIYFDVNGAQDTAQVYFTQARNLSYKKGYTNLQVRATNNLGMTFWNAGDYKTALDYFFKALQLNQKVLELHKVPESTMYNNIGLIYQEMNLFSKALQYHLLTYNLRKKNKRFNEMAASLNNIGICYRNTEQPDKAIAAFEEGMKLAKQYNALTDYYKILENYGNTLADKKEYSSAVSTYLKALAAPPSIKISDKSKITIYGGLTYSCNNLKQPQTALKYGSTGLQIINKNPEMLTSAGDLYLWISHTYYMLGNTGKGQEYALLSSQVTKNVFSGSNAKEIANLEIKYETEKKEKLIAENKAKLIKTEAEAKQKNIMFITSLFFIFLLVIIAWLLLRQQKLKGIQMKKEFELKTALSETESQNRLQEQRLSISRDLHDNIGAQLTFIISTLDTIRYRLPADVMAVGHKIDSISNFTRHTIIELRDTIWAMNSNCITFEDLRIRIMNFIDKAKQADENTGFKFTISPGLTHLELSSPDGMNIYRTIQEAVNNALKHSGATLIEIMVFTSNNTICITISDNGRGLNNIEATAGNGLYNMQKRINDAGGTIHFSPVPQTGLLITIQLPLKLQIA